MIVNNDSKNAVILTMVKPARPDERPADKSKVEDRKVKGNKNVRAQNGRGEQESSRVEQYLNRTIRFEVDKELRSVIAKVIDKESGEVIRQIPPEELVALAKKIKGSKGNLLDKEA